MKCLSIAVIDMKIHIELNAINVGNNLRIEAQINNDEVNPLIIKNHQIWTPNNKPGKMIIALANQDANSILL